LSGANASGTPRLGGARPCLEEAAAGLGLVTFIGHAAAISAGEWITATGKWVNDRTQQFKALLLKTSGPTTVYLLWRGHCDKLTAFRSAARKSQPSGKDPGWVEDATL